MSYGTFSRSATFSRTNCDEVVVTCYVSTRERIKEIEELPPQTPNVWQWVSVVGRDEDAGSFDYQAVLKRLENHYDIDTHFTNATRLGELVMPQFVASSTHPPQCLLVLRVANPVVGAESDSTTKLSNRWILIVDTAKQFIVTLTRVDTQVLMGLRDRWEEVCDAHPPMDLFVATLIAESLRDYSAVLRIQERLIDLCESRLLSVTMDEDSEAARDELAQYRVMLNYFEGPKDKQVIREMMRRRGGHSGVRGTIFFYHIVRALRVQHRVLQAVHECLEKPHVRALIGDAAPQLISRSSDLAHKALNRRDDAQQLLDTAMSLSSYRTNELMSILTKVSIVCTPPMLLAGVYGMNFEFMPELSWRYGYLFFWVCAILLGIGGYIGLRLITLK